MSESTPYPKGAGKRKPNGIKWLMRAAGLVGLGLAIFVYLRILNSRIPNEGWVSIINKNNQSEPLFPTTEEIPAAGIDSIRVSEVDGMEMVTVPAGEFLMGSRADDPDAFSNEDPQHTVYLDDFWMDRSEVTNAMYAMFLKASGKPSDEIDRWVDNDSKHFHIIQVEGAWRAEEGLEDHPVVMVNWQGAQSYCQWAGRRLPTEAEWEKAARGTDGRSYPWGERIDCQRANYGNCTGERCTQPVGSYPDGASPYGVLDMGGNVWEWVADWYDSEYYDQSPSKNPSGPESGIYRVLKGGSCYYYKWSLRTAIRYWNYADLMHSYLGFRCAK